MSYSNPTWYGTGDPMAAQKAFQKSFNEVYSSAENFFTEVDNQVKQDELTLQKQAQEMRKQLSNAKRAVPYTKAEINKLVRTFYEENKPSRINDGGSFLKRVYTTRSSGIDKAKLDEAQSNFKGYSDNINLFTEFALSEKYNDKTTDKGNALYLPLMQAKAAYAKDPSSLKSEYKDGEFKFYVEYGEGKRMDMDELSAGIQGLDPSVRQGIDNEKNAFVKRAAGITKTIIDEKYELDRAAGTTGVIRGPEVVAAEVEKDLRLKVSSSEEGSNFVQDQFNNNVQIGPKAKAQIFETVTIDGETQEAFNGADLLGSINEIKDPSKRAKALDAFNLILDVPIKDQDNIDKLTNIMREAGASSKDLDNINQGLEEFQLKAVKAQLVQDVLATGVDSKYIAAPKFTSKRSRQASSSSSRSGTSGTSGSSDSGNMLDYAEQKGFEIGSIINSLSSRLVNTSKQQAKWDKAPLRSTGTRPTFDGSFAGLPEVRNIKVGGSTKKVQNIQADEKGNIKVTYWATTPDSKGDVLEQDVSYNMYNPNSMRKFYSATAVQGGNQGKEPMKLYSSYYDKTMVNQYTSPQGIMSIATDKNMSAWLDFVVQRGGDDAKVKILSVIAANPGVVNMQSPRHWREFAKRNATLIDDIKKYNELTK